MKEKIYIYPLTLRDKDIELYNPYIDDLIQSFGDNYTFVNSDKPSSTGIFDIVKYIGKTNYVFFNWIEKLPELKGGYLQSLFLFLLVPVLKIFKVRIIWTMHNKLTHAGKHKNLTKAIFKLMLRKANIIITHSKEGINFGSEIIPPSVHFTYYLPHPVKDRRLQNKAEKEIDILIWGTVSPYKGIDNFLEYLYKNELEKKYNILIVGKVSSPEYDNQLQNYSNDNIRIENRFIEDDHLRDLISKSKIVLFTYSKASILSSGVLMDSLGYGANVVGPNTGAFADLAAHGIIDKYYDFDEMISKIDRQLSQDVENQQGSLELFLSENSWPKYANKVHRIIQQTK